jgi:hypothetical protein
MEKSVKKCLSARMNHNMAKTHLRPLLLAKEARHKLFDLQADVGNAY